MTEKDIDNALAMMRNKLIEQISGCEPNPHTTVGFVTGRLREMSEAADTASGRFAEKCYFAAFHALLGFIYARKR